MKRVFQEKGRVFINCILVLCLMLCCVYVCMKAEQKDENVSKYPTQETESETQTEPEIDTESDIETEPDTDVEIKPETENESDTKTDKEPEVFIPNEKRTIGSLLRTALQPVGSTMYVWGGGWNEEDTGAGIEAVTLGLSLCWAEFAALQDATYNYQNTRYQIHDGLDCSGYIGWSIYNIMETENGKEGYVMKASTMALNLAAKGWGTYTQAADVTDWKAGDIMSMDGHVWMVIGSCSDGSVVFMHASPPGVSIAGTVLEDGSHSEAVRLAEQYMRTYYPGWYERYPDCSKGFSYLEISSAMRWNRQTLADEEGLTDMLADDILEWLFSQR